MRSVAHSSSDSSSFFDLVSFITDERAAWPFLDEESSSTSENLSGSSEEVYELQEIWEKTMRYSEWEGTSTPKSAGHSSSGSSSFFDITDEIVGLWTSLDEESSSTSETLLCSPEEEDGRELQEIWGKTVHYSEWKDIFTPKSVVCISELKETEPSSEKVYGMNDKSILRELLENPMQYSEWERVSTPDSLPSILELEAEEVCGNVAREKVSTPDPTPSFPGLEKPRRRSERLKNRHPGGFNFKDYLYAQQVSIAEQSRLIKRVSPIRYNKRNRSSIGRGKETRNRGTQTNPLVSDTGQFFRLNDLFQ